VNQKSDFQGTTVLFGECKVMLVIFLLETPNRNDLLLKRRCMQHISRHLTIKSKE